MANGEVLAIAAPIASTKGFLVNVLVVFMLCFLPLLSQQDLLLKNISTTSEPIGPDWPLLVVQIAPCPLRQC
jgi:hypothetical protein